MKGRMKALLEADGVIIAEDVREAGDFFTRLLGLMYKKDLPSGQALLLAPCNSIHTFGMKFAIDVIFLDPDGIVLKVIRSLGRGKIVGIVPGGHTVLEMKAGSLPNGIELDGKKIIISE